MAGGVSPASAAPCWRRRRAPTTTTAPADDDGDRRRDVGDAVDRRPRRHARPTAPSTTTSTTTTPPTTTTVAGPRRARRRRRQRASRSGGPSRAGRSRPSSGARRAARVVLVIGVIHGDEDDGVAILERLATAPVPAGVDLWLVESMNPDGQAAAAADERQPRRPQPQLPVRVGAARRARRLGVRRHRPGQRARDAGRRRLHLDDPARARHLVPPGPVPHRPRRGPRRRAASRATPS